MSNRYSILAIGLVAIVATCALSGVLILANDDSSNSDTSDTNSTVRSFSSYSNYSAVTDKVYTVEDRRNAQAYGYEIVNLDNGLVKENKNELLTEQSLRTQLCTNN